MSLRKVWINICEKFDLSNMDRIPFSKNGHKDWMTITFVKFLPYSRNLINSSLHSSSVPDNARNTMACPSPPPPLHIPHHPTSTRFYEAAQCGLFLALWHCHKSHLTGLRLLRGSFSWSWGRVWSTKCLLGEMPVKKRGRKQGWADVIDLCSLPGNPRTKLAP